MHDRLPQTANFSPSLLGMIKFWRKTRPEFLFTGVDCDRVVLTVALPEQL